ncbi:DNA polymerase [uncultured phage cr55_1]|uniref:DNA polymerase n=1 Tax=uncultured phage cr55_1 TaxID=2772060 RepID=A0A7M1RUN1_9CAUD|nr:DNA polymerase [uncultured phage cr55_1]QOR58137.1 DNA polymerase [uncultured phage cr55_1]
MKIKGKTCVVFDIEVLKNVFTCTCKNTETKQITVFEISPRRVDIQGLVTFFYEDYYFVGYNNIHYDNPILNYIIMLYNKHYFNSYSTRELTESIFRMSQLVIDKNSDFDLWKEYKYARNFLSIDLLTMLYSKALRVSLKEMQVTMQYKNVEEFVVDWHQDLPEKDIDRLISYNINDVESTEELLYRCKDLLELRIETEKDFGLPCLSLDRVNLGDRLLQLKVMEKTGLNKKQLENMKSPANYVDLEKVIFPWIKFESPILQKKLTDMKNQHNVSPGRKGYINTFMFGEMKVTIGVGGIHGDNGTCIIKPNEDELLLDSDVNSLYPSLMRMYHLYPPKLKDVLGQIFPQIIDDRLEFKRTGQKNKNETYKYMLNGVSGKMQDETSWLFSPFTVMQVRINGQLLLLMLAERLLKLGCKLYQINTDGILYKLKKSKYEELQQVLKEWEKLTMLTLETEEFTQFYQLAINDYFGVEPNNKIKKKGFFLTDIELGKGLTPKIIPEAIINYFVHNIPVEDTIKSCKDICKFLQAEKTGKQWTVEYNEQIQQRINRFYVSNSGYYLWKWKLDDTGKKSYQIMLKDHGVRLHNKFYSDEDLQWKYSQGETFQSIYDIDYQYYINQCIKVIEKLKPKQLNLFNFDEY